MSEKALKTILGSLSVLVVLYLGVTLLSGHRSTTSADSGLAAALEHATTGTPDSIRITTPAETIHLQHQGTTWMVNGYRADSSAVARLLDDLGSASVGSLVATTTANHARLHVDRDSAVTLDIRPAGGDSVRILLGKSAPTGGAVYARLPGETNTYLLEGDLRSAAVRPLKDWRDKTVVRVDTAAIATLAIQRGDTSIVLRHQGSGWQLAGKTPAAADSSRVHGLLEELGRLEGTGVAADTVPFRGEEHRSVVALGSAGDTLAAVEMTGKAYTWLARSPAQPTIFDIASWRVDRITPTAAELGGKKPAS